LNIKQTISELGLKQGAILAWSEPKVGQSLSPLFGRNQFPKKLFYSILLVAAMDTYLFLKGTFLTPVVLAAGSIALLAIAWPILKLIDRLTARNIWIYQNGVLVTHSGDRISIEKNTILKVHIYKTRLPNILAIEFQHHNNSSIVVAVPSNLPDKELTDALIGSGYPVSNGL